MLLAFAKCGVALTDMVAMATVPTENEKMKRLRKMYEMRKNGCTYREIGQTFGISRQRVQFILKHYGHLVKGENGGSNEET